MARPVTLLVILFIIVIASGVSAGLTILQDIIIDRYGKVWSTVFAICAIFYCVILFIGLSGCIEPNPDLYKHPIHKTYIVVDSNSNAQVYLDENHRTNCK
jgi:hypothetical protein